MALKSLQVRREDRFCVEMMARFRHGVSTVMVMLKDLTTGGARIEGVGRIERDEAVFLTLPGQKPKMAFVAWSNEHGAGIEFADALDADLLSSMVRQFGRQPDTPAIAA